MSDFKYMTKTWHLTSAEDVEKMRGDIEKLFNQDWKPTTNGPCMALQTERVKNPMYKVKGEITLRDDDLEIFHYLVMYVFAKEKPHSHAN